MSEARIWLVVCDAEEIEEEDLIRFDHGGASYAVYRTASGFYASDGFCTHEHAHLADGLVIGEIIECPLHQGRFHIPSRKAKSPPMCIDLEDLSGADRGRQGGNRPAGWREVGRVRRAFRRARKRRRAGSVGA